MYRHSPSQKVVSVERLPERTLKLTLACGHVTYREDRPKYSCVGNRVRSCHECEQQNQRDYQALLDQPHVRVYSSSRDGLFVTMMCPSCKKHKRLSNNGGGVWLLTCCTYETYDLGATPEPCACSYCQREVAIATKYRHRLRKGSQHEVLRTRWNQGYA